MIDVTQVINWAKETYNAAPDPRAMLVILNAMSAQYERIMETRGQIEDLIAGWEEAASGFIPDLPSKQLAEDARRLLRDWNGRSTRFVTRLKSYYDERDAMARGEITGRYTAHVVAPVLYGQGYASPTRDDWSLVRSPDVAEPFRLQNELEAFAEGMGIEPGGYNAPAGMAFRWMFGKTEDYIEAFAADIRKGGEDLVREYAGAAGEEAAAAAGSELETRARAFVEEVKPEVRRAGTTGVLFGVLGGAALLGVGFVLFRRKRR